MKTPRSPKQFAEMTEVRNRLIAAGVCPDCKWRLARPGRLMCRVCSRRHTLRQRARINYQGRKRCGECRRRGHDIRTCKRRTEEANG